MGLAHIPCLEMYQYLFDNYFLAGVSQFSTLNHSRMNILEAFANPRLLPRDNLAESRLAGCIGIVLRLWKYEVQFPYLQRERVR